MISMIFLMLLVAMLIIGTVLAFGAYGAYTGRFGCDKTSFEMALPPAVMSIACYAIAYGFLCVSRMEWIF